MYLVIVYHTVEFDPDRERNPDLTGEKPVKIVPSLKAIPNVNFEARILKFLVHPLQS